MENIPSQEKTSVGILEHNTVHNSVSDEEIRQIGQNAFVYGPNSAVKRLKKTFPHLKFEESTARTFSTKYQTLLRKKASLQRSRYRNEVDL